MNFAKMFLAALLVALAVVGVQSADAGVQSRVVVQPVTYQRAEVATVAPIPSYTPPVVTQAIPVQTIAVQAVMYQIRQPVALQPVIHRQNTLVEVPEKVGIFERFRAKRAAKKAERQTAQRVSVQPVTLGCGE